ncbi:hypothetical protein PMIN03_012486 [Paraphaeosphaeria minitans]
MGVLNLISLFLALFEYASADAGYHNRAMWFVGNTTAPPPTETQPNKPDKVGTAAIINRCAHPVYIWYAFPSTHSPSP